MLKDYKKKGKDGGTKNFQSQVNIIRDPKKELNKTSFPIVFKDQIVERGTT